MASNATTNGTTANTTTNGTTANTTTPIPAVNTTNATSPPPARAIAMENDDDLSGGAIAGIVLGVLAGVALIVAVVVFASKGGAAPAAAANEPIA